MKKTRKYISVCLCVVMFASMCLCVGCQKKAETIEKKEKTDRTVALLGYSG